MKYIYHHLGLGDHFICNGLVRHYYSIYNNIKLFCKNHLQENIRFMYRDLPNLEVINFLNDDEVEQYIHKNNLKDSVIKVGFDKLLIALRDVETFDQGFYYAENLPFSLRFEKFYIERDHDRENFLFDKMTNGLKDYIFIHDDPARGMHIDAKKINNNLPIIKNDTSYLITDYLKILENATEIHLMQSCVKDMINSYRMPKPKIFLHNYIRNYDNYANSKGLNKFEVIY